MSRPVPKAPTMLTMDQSAFKDACADLADLMSDFEPDAIVGIATGGAYAALEVVEALERPVIHVDVKLSRGSTELKKRFALGSVLRRLPVWLTDKLRWLEVAIRERALGSSAGAMTMSDGEAELPRLAAAHRIVIVDDTIDSGRTLVAARDAVRAAAPDAEIRTAVLTSTWVKPPVQPDYCLHDRTLIRFFWSFDSARSA